MEKERRPIGRVVTATAAAGGAALVLAVSAWAVGTTDNSSSSSGGSTGSSAPAQYAPAQGSSAAQDEGRSRDRDCPKERGSQSDSSDSSTEGTTTPDV